MLSAFLIGGNAHGQVCSATNQIFFEPNGTVKIFAPTCGFSSGIEPISYMLAAKSAYADAMQIEAPAPTSNTCTSANPAVWDCVGYSRDCGVCGADPNAGASEMSCWCVSPETVEWNVHEAVAEQDATSISSLLRVDQNADGNLTSTEPILYSDPSQNGGSVQVRYYQLHNQLLLAEWEDLYNNGNGDFNDFSAAIEPRICNGIKFPVLQNSDNGRNCAFDCAGATNPTCGDVILQSDMVSFHVAVGVDSDVTEADRESRGRLIKVAVTTYYDRRLSQRNFAVCPALVFATADGAPPQMSIIKNDYGATVGKNNSCTITGDTSSVPVCRLATTPIYSEPLYPLALAKEQYYGAEDGCRSRTVSDAFEARNRGVCKQSQEPGHTEIYELSLLSVDGALDDPNARLSNATFAQIRDRLKYVQIVLAQDVENGIFYCPSGVNNVVGALNMIGATSGFETVIPTTSPNVVIYERD